MRTIRKYLKKDKSLKKKDKKIIDNLGIKLTIGIIMEYQSKLVRQYKFTEDITPIVKLNLKLQC